MPATEMSDRVTNIRRRNNPGNCALRKGRVSLPVQAYLVTTVTCGRQPFFGDFIAGCAAACCFDDARILGDARMLAWMLMPDHAHWLIHLGEVDALSAVVNRLKSSSACRTNRVLRRGGVFWARAFHNNALRADEDLRRSARYVIANPVRVGLVERIGDYPFWNAIWA